MNRFALITIAVAANCIGLLPYLLFVDHLAYLLVAIPASAMTAFFALRQASTEATARPSLAEWLLGAWSAVSKPSTASLTGLMFFGLFYWGYELFSWAARVFDFAPGGDPWTWGHWGSFGLLSPAGEIETIRRCGCRRVRTGGVGSHALVAGSARCRAPDPARAASVLHQLPSRRTRPEVVRQIGSSGGRRAGQVAGEGRIPRRACAADREIRNRSAVAVGRPARQGGTNTPLLFRSRR